MTSEGADGRASGWTARQGAALRRLSDRTSLRTKLITALLVLVAAAVAAISISSVWVLGSYLTSMPVYVYIRMHLLGVTVYLPGTFAAITA